ncbi:hypothetical protein PYH37_004992 [Sinorhizobium numidicum]|uniref:Uncharacterized protein n=1 Tax=Sinorhizobium numidicum TaxID=680248 RepID=A0ABY8CXE5_9HYPH|nr:hypothetical protein [Sinorhizobium numidicum]WEX76670.1 hypothetical protein PYH37_004992 [Sinorhizobium numidicum]WEX83331.1 hypothetical protein PYH38_005704 [Sinorhizobium numidicum]
MNDEGPDQMMLIGLHKLASQFGDGLVPELYELLTRRARMLEDNPNVTEFPAWQARQPGKDPIGLAPAVDGAILPFPHAAARSSADKKVLES